MRTVSRNNPIATVIKNYTNKKSGKVKDARNEIQRRFFGLDWKDQKRIMAAFLDSVFLTGTGHIQGFSTCGMPPLSRRCRHFGRPTTKKSALGLLFAIFRRNISGSISTYSMKAGIITSSAVGWQRIATL